MSIVQSVNRNVQVRGNDTATIFGDRRHSWMEFRERAARLAAGLKALGVARGDRVAILALNSDRYLEYYVECRGQAPSWCRSTRVGPKPSSLTR
jgi:long-chain acyl-CoA synthetase